MNETAFQRAQRKYDAEEHPNYDAKEAPEPEPHKAPPKLTEEQIEALNDTIYERDREIKTLQTELCAKQMTLDYYRLHTANQLKDLLDRIEAAPDKAATIAIPNLRSMLGLPVRP